MMDSITSQCLQSQRNKRYTCMLNVLMISRKNLRRLKILSIVQIHLLLNIRLYSPSTTSIRCGLKLMILKRIKKICSSRWKSYRLFHMLWIWNKDRKIKWQRNTLQQGSRAWKSREKNHVNIRSHPVFKCLGKKEKDRFQLRNSDTCY